jgi:hypothetical protein
MYSKLGTFIETETHNLFLEALVQLQKSGHYVLKLIPVISK